jgi:hypothetical protein
MGHHRSRTRCLFKKKENKNLTKKEKKSEKAALHEEFVF